MTGEQGLCVRPKKSARLGAELGLFTWGSEELSWRIRCLLYSAQHIKELD